MAGHGNRHPPTPYAILMKCAENGAAHWPRSATAASACSLSDAIVSRALHRDGRRGARPPPWPRTVTLSFRGDAVKHAVDLDALDADPFGGGGGECRGVSSSVDVLNGARGHDVCSVFS